MSGAAANKIGLLAGWGSYPIVVARTLREQGFQVFCLGIKDHADPVLQSICHDWRPIGLAKLGAAIRYFRRHGVVQATMAGKIHKVLIFRKYHWLKHLPDWRFFRTFYPHWITKTKDRKDDTLLGTIVQVFADEGIHFAPATNFAPELLVESGNLTSRRPTAGQWKDIAFGWRLAKELGRLDVGQSVAVKGQAVLAVEAVEGTDECIRRAGLLCPAGGFTVVKVAKPQQDMRFDVPTIGPGTVQTLIEAGAGTLAIEAGKTIVLEREEVVRLADRHKLAIVAVDEEHWFAASAASRYYVNSNPNLSAVRFAAFENDIFSCRGPEFGPLLLPRREKGCRRLALRSLPLATTNAVIPNIPGVVFGGGAAEDDAGGALSGSPV